MSPPHTGSGSGPGPRLLQLQGLALFLFIPLVLYLFVVHPEPLAASLAAGVVLMLGHRWLARPYLHRAKDAKCLWCNRVPPHSGDGGSPPELVLATAGGPLTARCCPGHREGAARYLTFLDRWRWPLRLGIFLPLLALLLIGALAAAGWSGTAGASATTWLVAATASFQLLVGLTVNLAACGYLAVRPRERPWVPFPVHNFYLLGLRNLLWIFRLVGIWWIWVGAARLWELMPG